MATDPLITTRDVEVWAQLPVGELEDNPFAIAIINAVSLLVREGGDPNWTALPAPVAPAIPVPPRVQLIAVLKAKNYFLNPTGNISENTGPLGERKIEEVVHNMTLNDEEKAELARLAGLPDPGQPAGGLWVQPVGPPAGTLVEDVFVTDQSGSDWMIPWARIGDHLYPEV